MLKIFEKIKRKKAKKTEYIFCDKKRWNKIAEELLQGKAEKEIVGLQNSLVNRPLEGEIVNIKNIKIPQSFKKPKKSKIQRRREYFKKYGYFRSTIILNNKNSLLDGYTTYLLAKEAGFSYITILREN